MGSHASGEPSLIAEKIICMHEKKDQIAYLEIWSNYVTNNNDYSFLIYCFQGKIFRQ